MKREIVRIKKHGKLIAFGKEFKQYWLYEGCLYEIGTDAKTMTELCDVASLDDYLLQKYQLLGYKFFTENRSIVVVDKAFLSQFEYA